MTNIKKLLFGTFIGIFLAGFLTSTYFYTFFKKVMRRLDIDLKDFKDLN